MSLPIRMLYFFIGIFCCACIAQAFSIDKIKEIEMEVASQVPKILPGPGERHPISVKFVISPLKALIDKFENKPDFEPSESDIRNLFITLKLFNNALYKPNEALIIYTGNQNSIGLFSLTENPNVSYHAHASLAAGSVILEQENIDWAIDILYKTGNKVSYEEEFEVVKKLKVVQVPHNKMAERFAISKSYVLEPAIEIIRKMRADSLFIPDFEQRRLLFIAASVIDRAIKDPAALVAYKGTDKSGLIKNLKENTNISIKVNPSIGVQSKVVTKAELDWLLNKLYERAAKIIPEVHTAAINCAELQEFALQLALKVNVFFKEPYKESLFDKKCRCINKIKYTVYRPNHALSHGMTTAFLALDALELFRNANEFDFKAKPAQFHAELAKKHWQNDANFWKKVMMAAAYQRTGRQSEVSGKESDEAAKKYTAYLQEDVKIFEEEALKHLGPEKLFKDTDEINAFKRAIYNDPNPAFPALSKELDDLRYFVHQLIWSGHMLHLKRLSNESPNNPKKKFPASGVKASAAINLGLDSLVNKQGSEDWKDYIFRSKEEYPCETNFINNMWNRVEKYLEANGDRPESSGPYAKYLDSFFLQAYDPALMVEELVKAKMAADGQNTNGKF